MATRVGTSGFLYEHWRGRFYPPRPAAASWSTTPRTSTPSS